MRMRTPALAAALLALPVLGVRPLRPAPRPFQPRARAAGGGGAPHPRPLRQRARRAAAPRRRGARARDTRPAPVLLDTLRAYRDRGDFPHNYDFPGQAVPYFVDRGTGTLCAVAYLLAASGRRDVVDRVTRADNNVWVPALAADTAFTGWLAASGLTLGEPARIQVPYMGDEPPAVAPAVGLGAATTDLCAAAVRAREGEPRRAVVTPIVPAGQNAGVGALVAVRF